jgi:hypothetical protein
MRHFPPPDAVAALTVGVVHAARAAALIPRPGRPTGGPPRRLGAARAAVTVTAVAVATDHHLPATTGAVEQAGGGGHRQLPPMRPGSPPTSGRYLPTARARHAPGCGTGEDCGGRDQCRTCLNGTDAVDHGAALVTSRAWLPLGRARDAVCYQERGPRRLGAGSVPGGATLRRGRTRRRAAATRPYTIPFPQIPSPLGPPATRRAFTTLAGDYPRYPPNIRRFG